jgi:transposase
VTCECVFARVIPPMNQQKLLIEHTLPTSLGEAHEMIKELLLLNKNAEEHRVRVQKHFEERLGHIKKLFRLAVTKIYGSSSEASRSLFNEVESVVIDQPEPLSEDSNPFLGDSEPKTDGPKNGKNSIGPKARKRGPIPPHLPRLEILHDLDESKKNCVMDGTALVRVGEDVREELVVIPAKILVHKHVTPKYGCPKCHCGITAAEAPKRILPGTIASPSMLASLITNKYSDHLPLYRQQEIFARMQIDISRSTMASWIIKGAEGLMPLVNLIKDEILDGPSVQCDETPINILDKDHIEISQKSYMWVMGRYGPDRKSVLYELGPKRSGDVATRLLGDYPGYLQTDGLRSYDELLASVTGKRLGCMAHVRRKFVDLLKGLPKDKRSDHPAAEVVAQIAKLYKVESDLKENPTESFFSERSKIRGKISTGLFEELESIISRSVSGQSTASAYGSALKYAESELPKIKLYLTHGECEIDNNWIENMIRPFALGRKNWLFSQTVKGADASANIYTVVQTAKINGLNVQAYLESVFTRLPYCTTLEDYQNLLPWAWRQ